MTLRDKFEGDRQIPLTPYVARLLTELRDRKPKKPPGDRGPQRTLLAPGPHAET